MIEESLPGEQRRFYLEVGRRIRDARTKQVPKMTQDALANLVGLTRTSITNVEQGRQKCLLHTLADIASALRVPAGSLLPAFGRASADLDGALKDRPHAEQNWIMSAVKASQQSKARHGS